MILRKLLAVGVMAVGVVLIPMGQAPAAGTGLYDTTQLKADKKRYARRVGQLMGEGLLAFMTAEEKRAVRGVVVQYPLRAAGPLTFASAVVEGSPTIRAPVTSLKFIEDLSVAYAWRYQNQYSLEPIDEYLVMLKHRPAADFSGGRKPDPMTALGVPPRIWEQDTRVDELSLRFRNTAWAFILAHELGHLRSGHHLTGATPAEIQRQEEDADAFALDLLGRSETVPMGMILWFQATAGYRPNRSDFASDAAYTQWLQSAATHPVNGRRLRHLADLMNTQAKATGDANAADVLRFIAVRLTAIGEIVEDPEMQRHLKRCADTRRPSELGRLVDRPC